jgi:hypothetical protein
MVVRATVAPHQVTAKAREPRAIDNVTAPALSMVSPHIAKSRLSRQHAQA